MTRHVQMSLVEGMERPVGPIPASVQNGDNADLMLAVKPLRYLDGLVADVTYGSGPGGHNIVVPKRARRHHSYLVVFTKDKR